MKSSMTKAQAQERLTRLRALIDHHRYEYHVLDRQSISDAALDSLKHELTNIEQEWPELMTPDSPSQRVAGKPLPGFTKVTHRQRMVSLSDIFSEEELRDWDARWRKLEPSAKTQYLIDVKLDGLAVSLMYVKGLFTQAATRGDGFVGEDVTLNVKTIEAVPLRLRTEGLTAAQRKAVLTGTVEIRGEIVMLKKDFNDLNRRQEKAGLPPFANPRNVSAGSIRQLDPKITARRKLTFFAWELVSDLGQATLTEAYALLRAVGVPVNPRAATCATLDDVVAVHQRIEREREKLPFWIDGAVIKVDNRSLYSQLGIVGKTPRAAAAWKFAAEQATTVVEDIVIQVGRTGALTPVAHLRPVSVAGTTVARATLHNADEVRRLGVRIGDTVILQKAGDIIPDVVRVLTELRPKNASVWAMPKQCPVCASPIERREGEAIHYCHNRTCPARQRESLYHFVSKKAFDIAGLGPSTVDVLIDENLVHEPADLFHLKANQLNGLPLFAELKSDKLITALRSARTIRIDRLLYALGIRHVGEQTAIDLAQQFGTLQALMKASAADIQKVPNIGSVVAQSVAHWFAQPSNKRQVEHLMKELTIRSLPKAQRTPLQGKTVVITGTLPHLSRAEAEELVRRAGGKTSSTVSAKTSYVLAGDEPGSKLARANALSVPVLTEAQFTALVQP